MSEQDSALPPGAAMQTDQELCRLVELAAKAAGYAESGWMGGTFCYVEDNRFVFFDPLNNDADALRLAVKLRMDVAFNDMYVMAFPTDGGDGSAEAYHVDDPMAATRRAIVRAAADMGRGMP